MKKQHYGAIAAVLFAFVVCRLLAFRITDLFGTITGHGRFRGGALGVVIGVVPFAVLLVFAFLQWRHVDVDRHRWLEPLGFVGWAVTGVVIGILPYSRFGTDTNLMTKEKAVVPGFLHALDVTIVVGLLFCVVVLVVAVQQGALRRPHPFGPRVDEDDKASRRI